MSLHKCRIAAVLGVLLFALYCAPLANAGSLPTIRELLTEKGVALDHESLIAALRNPDQIIRSLAAQELADTGATDASPYIVAAFENSTESVPRFNLAQALLKLDKAEALRRMTQICQNKHEREGVRLRSIGVLEDAGNHDCDAAVVTIAERSEDPSVKLVAVALLNSDRYQAANPRQKIEVEAKLLNDENDAVRMAAGSALGKSEDAEAHRLIVQRLRVETDPDVRKSLLQAANAGPRS